MHIYPNFFKVENATHFKFNVILQKLSKSSITVT